MAKIVLEYAGPRPGTQRLAANKNDTRSELKVLKFKSTNARTIDLTSGTYPTGARQMKAWLGPDLGQSIWQNNGTNGTGIPVVMDALRVADRTNFQQDQRWVAGHLLNADLGGINEDENLTPLTKTANSRHENFEGHIARMLSACHKFDTENPESEYWCGVWYEVVIGGTHTPGSNFSDEIYRAAGATINVEYKYIGFRKFPENWNKATHPPIPTSYFDLDDTEFDKLRACTKVDDPNRGTTQWEYDAGTRRYSATIHNTHRDQ